jgi:glutaconate CoA-transferase subunit B
VTPPPYSAAELMAAVLARDLRDGETGVTPYSPIIFAACRLAQLTHAPALTFWSGTLGVNPKPARLYETGADYRYLEGVEAIADFYDVFQYGETGCSFMFYSGLQIDRFGNANNLGRGTDPRRPRVRAPGQANTSHPVSDERFYLFSTAHTPDVFVPRVDFVTIAGFLDGGDSRRRAGLPGGGPRLCVTDRAVMDFDPAARTMRLASVHEGHTVEEVRAHTGFPLPAPGEVPVTPPPTGEELDLLRRVIDPTGVLRRGPA